MKGITALVPTYNNASILPVLLSSLSWADRILVVDSFSTDDTAHVAQTHGAMVLQQKYINSANQKNWALKHIETEWVFQIDTDEEMESGMAEEILETLRKAPEGLVALQFRRKNHYGNYWLKHGGMYPDYQTRLFRTRKCEWSSREVHAKLLSDGETDVLDHHIIHFGMPSISKQLANIDRYTLYERDELIKKKRKAGVLRIVLRPPLVFFYRWLWLRGIMDGWRGFVLAVYAGFYDFVSSVKLYETATNATESHGKCSTPLD